MYAKNILYGAAALSLSVGSAFAQCESYGIDFVNGGSYFINSADTSPFTAVEEFSGCDDDVANNVLVDPQGNQYQCSDTPLTPDYTPQTINCTSVLESGMQSGDWSLLIISNNGDGDPISYERDFSLDVGAQETATATPTVTVTTIQTAINTIYVTATKVATTTAAAKTTTVSRLLNLGLTQTSLVLPTVSVVTKTFATVTNKKRVPSVTTSLTYAQATCAPPQPNWIPDPKARITAHVLRSRNAGSMDLAGAKFRRAMLAREAISDELKAAFVAERRQILAAAAAGQLVKRAPDQQTITVTETATTDFVTVQATSTTATTDVTLTSTVLSTTTTTPPVVTVTSALINLKLATVLQQLLQPTVTKWVVATAVSTTSVPVT